MSRDNNLMVRARIDSVGSIRSFEISNYSGGAGLNLRIHNAGSGELFWVLDVSGIDRTVVFADATDWGWDRNDIDEMSLEALRLCRTATGLEEIDGHHRRDFERRNGTSLPRYLSRMDKIDLVTAMGG